MNFIRKNKLVRPIIEAITLKEIFLFIVLLGLLPSVEDLSLFWLSRDAELEFFLGEPTSFTSVVNTLPLLLVPLGLFVIIRLRNYWYVLGLLPPLIGIPLAIAGHFDALNHPEISSPVLAYSYRIAFLFFVIVGHVRSLSFFCVVVGSLCLVPIHHSVMFALMVCISRFVVLTISQNYAIFKEVKKAKLASLMLKSFFIWSPILLFCIPHFYLNDLLKTIGEDIVYKETFVERHYVYQGMPIDELVEAYSANHPGQVKTILEEEGYSSANHETIQKNVWKSLVLLRSKLHDGWKFKHYGEPAIFFVETYRTLDGNEYLTTEQRFVLGVVGLHAQKLGMRANFWGKDDMPLDVQLSLYRLLLKRQFEANEALKAREKSLDEQMDKQTAATKKKTQAIQDKLDSLANRANSATERTRQDIEDDTRREQKNAKDDITERFGSIEQGIQSDIDKIPGTLQNVFDEIAPHQLTDIGSGFANSECSGIDPSCWAANAIKGLLRRAYVRHRAVVKASVNRKSIELKKSATKRLGSTMEGVESGAHDAVDSAAEKIIKIADHSAGKTTDLTNATSKKMRAEVGETSESITEFLKEVDTTIKKTNERIQEEIQKSVDTINKETRTAVIAVHSYLLFVKISAWTVFIFVVLMSYLYVFSRVAFGAKNELYVTLREGEKKYPNGAIRQTGNKYTIPADHTEVFHVSRRFEPSGRAPKISVPHWLTSIPARIFKRCYWMNEIAVREGQEDSVDFRSVAGAEFVEWTLSEDEEVVFSYDNFVAMTDSISLSTAISLRFTTLLMGRPFFYVAKGPGTLVLITGGVPITKDDDKLVKVVSAERVIAWQKHAQFSVASELNMIDIYFSSLYLQRASDDLIIIDADTGSAKTKTGLLKFVFKFIFPI